MKIKNTKQTIKICLSILALSILVVFGLVYSDAQSIGSKVGSTAGVAVGALKGSYEGFVDGREAGKEAALVSDDIDVQINDLSSLGTLEVLEVNFTEYNAYTVGGEEDSILGKMNPEYAMLYSKEGKAIYTVDLKATVIEQDPSNPNSIIIRLPKIEVTTKFDESKTQSLDIYPQGGSKGTTADGTKGFDSSDKELSKKIDEAFSGDSSLKQSAIDSTRKQVEDLAKALTGKNVSHVLIKEVDY